MYETFFRPYIQRHESEIDRTLLELRTRAADFAVSYCHKAMTYGQTRFFEVLQFIASQKQSQSRKTHQPNEVVFVSITSHLNNAIASSQLTSAENIQIK